MTLRRGLLAVATAALALLPLVAHAQGDQPRDSSSVVRIVVAFQIRLRPLEIVRGARVHLACPTTRGYWAFLIGRFDAGTTRTPRPLYCSPEAAASLVEVTPPTSTSCP